MSFDTPFQNFDTTTSPKQGAVNVAALRREMARLNLDGFLVPHEDEHQNEYLPDANERLAWVSGFTGSAGAALILMDQAILFTDGRYTLQSREQTDAAVFSHRDYHAQSLADAVAELKSGQRIGYDPKLVSPSGLRALKGASQQSGVVLVPTSDNPLDTAWGNQRPPQPMAPIVAWPVQYAGTDSATKRKFLGEGLKKQGLAAALLTFPSSLAWLFNIRGGDVIRSPLPLGQALLREDGTAELYIESAKITPELAAHLGPDVAIKAPHEVDDALKRLSGQRVRLDANTASAFWVEAVEAAGGIVDLGDDPCLLPRACKNAVEIAATTEAHLRDGAIMTQFLHWVATEAQEILPSEIEVAQKLEAFRRASGGLKDLSFDTISAFGPHGALPHYRVTTLSDIRCEKGGLLLVDSGAQFEDGTTDITRVMPIGTPSAEHKRMFTLVLKGHIALATACFPEGTTGTHLDALARQFLWAEGFDYDHGTGHGVGVYLGVHEGPQRIAKALNSYALRPGMIVSNEPGYYKAGDFGIRIENLQYVTTPKLPEGGERAMLGFETLTYAPIDRYLIDGSLLSAAERAYVDAYHAKVLALIGPRVRGEVKTWLEAMCAPL